MDRTPALRVAALTRVGATAGLMLVTMAAMHYYVAAHDPCAGTRTVCDSPSIVGFGLAAWSAAAGAVLIARVVFRRLLRGDDGAPAPGRGVTRPPVRAPRDVWLARGRSGPRALCRARAPRPLRRFQVREVW